MQKPPLTSPISTAASKGQYVLLGCLFLAALGLRLWFGSAWPVQSRFWDERYALENPHSIIVEKTLKPSRSYYPSPVFNVPAAVTVAIAEKASSEPTIDVLNRETGEFGPLAYRLLRGLQGLFGAIAVLLIYRVGALVLGPSEGLLAAIMLTFIPWQIRVGGVFKPDGLLGMTVVLSLLWSLRLLERPGLKSAILSGLGIALAMSAKMTGGVLAIPLAIAMVWRWGRESRRLLWLGIAGLASALWFVLLNPYWYAYPIWLAGLRRDYAMRAEVRGLQSIEIPGQVLEFLAGPYIFGIVLGLVALGGYLALVHRLIRASETGRSHRAQLLMLVAFPPLFTMIYLIQTPYFKPNNFLPIVPILALGGSHLLIRSSRRVADLLNIRSISVEWVVIVAVLSWMGTSGFLFVYRSLVPTTTNAALEFLATRTKVKVGRYVFGESVQKQLPPWSGPRQYRRTLPALMPSGNLETVSRHLLDLADGEIYLGKGLDSEFFKERAARVVYSDRRIFQNRLFEMRGPTLAVLRHRFRGLVAFQLESEDCGERQLCIQLPKVKRRSICSLDIGFDVASDSMARILPEMRAGRYEFSVYPVRSKSRAGYDPIRDRLSLTRVEYFSTRRFLRSEIGPSIQLVLPLRADPNTVRVSLTLWEQIRRSRRLSRSEADVVGVGELLEEGQVKPGEES